MPDHERIDLDGEDEAILDRIAETRPARGPDYERRIRSMHREAVSMLRDERREIERLKAVGASKRMGQEFPEREDSSPDPAD